ncbi:MAG: recombination regulator RecX [Gemmatimonadota bacterium]|nr:recombination regulator RecX [Gemmatimonadota bacterium]MDH5759290.1 recombination regulator RecX [Gemmatimonadota bacterium]
MAPDVGVPAGTLRHLTVTLDENARWAPHRGRQAGHQRLAPPHRSMPHPVITRLEPLRPRGLIVRLHLDRGDPLEVALEAVEKMGLGPGDELPGPRRDHLLEADARWRVREAALSLLSFRARTRSELARKLRKKEFPSHLVDACLDTLEERGLVDDAAVAAAFVRDRLRFRPRGRVRLTQELRGKGVDSNVVERVIDDVMEQAEVTDTDLALEVVDGWISRQRPEVLDALKPSAPRDGRDRIRRRLHAFLARRGFRGEAVQAALERASSRDPETK